MTQRLAMWSGPRNISTALMRSFEARGDCKVVDEPFYAWYLANSDVRHPMHDAILSSQPTEWYAVVAGLLTSQDQPLCYQKHMAHHMVGDEDYDWLAQLVHAFLVRDPAAMIASYQQKRESVRAVDLGLERQKALYLEVVERTGQTPPIILAADVLSDPAGYLAALCRELNIPWTRSMLSWKSGPRDSDGVWAPHWYNVVMRTEGFAQPSEQPIKLDAAGRRVLTDCEADFAFFFDRRLQISP